MFSNSMVTDLALKTTFKGMAQALIANSSVMSTPDNCDGMILPRG